MTSVLIAYALSSIIFWAIDWWKKEQQTYSIVKLAIFYLITRGYPLFYLDDKQLGIQLIQELLLIVIFLCVVWKKIGQAELGRMFAYYLFQPLGIFFLAMGKPALLCINGVILVGLYLREKHSQSKEYLSEYILVGIGAWMFVFSEAALGQSFSEIGYVEDIFQMCVIGLAVLFFAQGCILIHIFRGKPLLCLPIQKEKIKRFRLLKEEASFDTLAKGNTIPHVRFRGVDWICIFVFTLIFGCMVFYQLGSHEAPETFETLVEKDKESSEIVLNFNQQVSVSKIWIYLGREAKREISFSYKESGESDWTVFAPSQNVESVFCWNAVEVNHRLEALKMVLMKDTAYLHEIVVLDMERNRVTPSNAADYPNLFDEQKMFPSDPSYYHRTMFDEVYHARTAYEFLHQTSIYENTHPPLGKSIISLGIRIFGMNPFGWRVMCAICGILMIPLVYWMAHRMFGGTIPACFTSILLCTGFMNLTLSRIATLDIIIALFVMVMFYFTYEMIYHMKGLPAIKTFLPWVFVGGIALGLSIATKWTGVYAAVGVAVIFFYFLWEELEGLKGVKEHSCYLMLLAVVCVLCFIAIPLTIYVCSYVPFAKVYTDKGLIGHAISNGQLMLDYHSNAMKGHPFSSQWYEWLIDKRPLWDSITRLPDGRINSVATFGNPLILWIGLAAVFHNIYLWMCKHNRTSGFLVIAYASVLLPWLFIKRTVFIYQYFLGILVLIMMLSYSVQMLRKKKQWMIALSVVNIGLLILYFPVLTGLSVDADFVKQVLEIMDSWTFV